MDPIIITLDALTRRWTAGREAAAEVSSCRPSAPATLAWCDRCGNPALSTDGSPRRWPSPEAAVVELTGELWGWQARESGMICGSCLLSEQCEASGHVWSKWKSLAAAGGGLGEMIRFCDVCAANEFADTLIWVSR